jgi:microcystin-dependent protein
VKYTPPVGGGEGDPYVDPNPALGTDGSGVPAAAIEDPQREIEEVISSAGLTPSVGDLTQLRQAVEALIAAGVAAASATLAGTIRWSASASPGPNELLCNGAAVSRATYADLFAAIGTTYGAGDGSTTFNLPEARGRVPVAAGAGPGLTSRALGASFGAETHTLTLSEGPNHQHTIPFRDDSGGGATFAGPANSSGPTVQTQTSGSLISGGATHSEALGSAVPHNNVQPSVVFNAFIHI